MNCTGFYVVNTSVLMGSIKAAMFVEDLGMGMSILKGLEIHGVEKSESLNRLSVPIIAPGNMFASCINTNLFCQNKICNL
jgi:hypothetical protein